MKIAVIGAGITGTASAYYLADYAEVVVFEKELSAGGLCSAVDCTAGRIEKYNHFISASDLDLIELIRDLGLENKLFFRQTSQSIVKDGCVYRLNGGRDLLNYPFLSFYDKCKLGLFYLRHLWGVDPERLFDLEARDWIEKQTTVNVFRHFFEPLLKFKFENFSGVSAAYLWARMNEKKNNRIGYLQGSMKELFLALTGKLEQKGVRLRTGTRITGISRSGQGCQVETANSAKEEFDYVISTLPAAETFRLSAEGINTEAGEVMPRYLNVRSCLMSLKEPPGLESWIYLIDTGDGLRVLIDASVLTGKNFLYFPQYSEKEFSPSDDEGAIRDECLSILKFICPDIKSSAIEDFVVCRDQRVEPVLDGAWLRSLRQGRYHFDGLYISELFYEPRLLKTINTCLVKGRAIARDIIARGKAAG